MSQCELYPPVVVVLIGLMFHGVGALGWHAELWN